MGALVMIGTVVVDGSIHELHSISGEATEHPIEDGATIADHYHLRPRKYQIDGIITNQPLELPSSNVSGVREVDKPFTWKANPTIFGGTPLSTSVGGAGLIGMVGGAIASAAGLDQHTGMARGFEPEFNRVASAREELIKYMTDGAPIEITTALEVYPNMVIESFDIDRDKSTGDSMKFSITALQIRIVSTEFSVAPPLPKVERGKPASDKGKKSTKALDATKAEDTAITETADSNVSLLSSMTGF